MLDRSNSGPRPDAGLITELEKSNLHPVWDRFQKLTPLHPAAQDKAGLWRWQDIAPLAARAAVEVPVADVERRALILVNPAFAGKTITTTNMIAAFTVLEPGDRARPHRHTMSALRFATDAEGAVTIVNGRRCEMQQGDLIITPPMSWHGHINESDRRTVWFDATNMPLINSFDANFFEGGASDDEEFWKGDEGDERMWAGAGIEPSDAGMGEDYPKFRYPGEVTRRLLSSSAAGEDGSHTLRYTNPRTGGPVMPTMDCYAVRIKDREPTRQRRTTWNAVCLVVSGSGQSTIGGEMITWSKNDVFSIPHWTWASHQAESGEADLFVVTDRAAYERLELAREQIA